jgi:tripartite-type tricarboxylate transporter receptor subunit TctC
MTPQGTPKDALDRLDLAVVKVMSTPEMRESLRRQGFDEFLGSSSEFAAFLSSEMTRWGDAVRRSGARSSEWKGDAETTVQLIAPTAFLGTASTP